MASHKRVNGMARTYITVVNFKIVVFTVALTAVRWKTSGSTISAGFLKLELPTAVRWKTSGTTISAGFLKLELPILQIATPRKGESSIWSCEENKIFENGLAIYPEDLEDRWERIAAAIPEKSIEEVKQHYKRLVDDIKVIENGCVPLPSYNSSSDGDGSTGEKRSAEQTARVFTENQSRKGVVWTADEHKLFLLGLETYGKGDWRSISRYSVVTRTPAQVASHAQKYFNRLKSDNKNKKRSSIHDITNVDKNDILRVPITGQQITCSFTGDSSTNPSEEPSQSPSTFSGVGMHGGTTAGQPVGGGYLISASAADIPSNFQQSGHMTKMVRAGVLRQIVPRPPMNMELD